MIRAVLLLSVAATALQVTRRTALAAPTLLAAPVVAAPAWAAEGQAPLPGGREPLLALVREARAQLDAVPGLIKDQRWDSVRAVLITPPLSDCWAKNARPLLRDLAAAVGDAGGDEVGVLEANEEAGSHLRYLDMAVYNRVHRLHRFGRRNECKTTKNRCVRWW